MDRMLWVDIETTGLEEHAHLLLEVGLVLTDAELRVVAETSRVIHWHGARERAGELVQAMHDASGLWLAVERSELGRAEAQEELLAWVQEHDAAGLYMAGSGVHFDRRWLRQWMPALASAWHYRNFDLTTLRYFWGSEKREPAHRALADLHQSIGDLRAFTARARAAGLLEPGRAAVA